MPRNYQPKVKLYTEASIATAVEEVKNVDVYDFLAFIYVLCLIVKYNLS